MNTDIEKNSIKRTMTPQFQKAFSFWMIQDTTTKELLESPTPIKLGNEISQSIVCAGSNPSQIHPDGKPAFYPLAPHLKPVKVRVTPTNRIELVNGHAYFESCNSYFEHSHYWPILFGLIAVADNLNLLS